MIYRRSMIYFVKWKFLLNLYKTPRISCYVLKQNVPLCNIKHHKNHISLYVLFQIICTVMNENNNANIWPFRGSKNEDARLMWRIKRVKSGYFIYGANTTTWPPSHWTLWVHDATIKWCITRRAWKICNRRENLQGNWCSISRPPDGNLFS